MSNAFDSKESLCQWRYFISLLRRGDVNRILSSHHDLSSGKKLEKIRVWGLFGLNEQSEDNSRNRPHFIIINQIRISDMLEDENDEHQTY